MTRYRRALAPVSSAAVPALLSLLLALALVGLAPAPAAAERVVRHAWGCVIEVGGPYATRGPRARVHASAGVSCPSPTRFTRAVVRLMRARPGPDQVIAVDRVPTYWHVRNPIDLQWPEAWGVSVEARTRCRAAWTVSDPRLYTRAVFRKAGQSKRVVVTTRVWSSQAGVTCLRG